MEKPEIHIIQLEPFRAASFYGFGTEPELQALGKLQAWAGPRGYLNNPQHRIFGFNNPNPSHGSPNYGYEFWITVAPEVEPDDAVLDDLVQGSMRVVEFGGGLYAVLHLADPFAAPYERIPAGWEALVRWLEDSPYQHGGHQWLEEHLMRAQTPDEGWDMDLYLPIVERLVA